MSNTRPGESLRQQAGRHRERKEAEERTRRTEQEGLNRCRRAIETLGESVYALRCSLDPFESPPTEAELEEHYSKVTPLLGEALSVLREANVLSKLEQLDEPGTLALYRRQGDDPQATQIAYAHAKQMIEADPADRQQLAQLVRDAAEEPGLRRAWDWVSILLCGLTGQQRLGWKQEPSERNVPNPQPPLASEDKKTAESWDTQLGPPVGGGIGKSGNHLGKRGRKPLRDCDARERDNVIADWERFRGSKNGNKKDFCKDHKIRVKELNNILAWKRTRRNRSKE
jgi:hypothetical protein